MYCIRHRSLTRGWGRQHGWRLRTPLATVYSYTRRAAFGGPRSFWGWPRNRVECDNASSHFFYWLSVYGAPLTQFLAGRYAWRAHTRWPAVYISLRLRSHLRQSTRLASWHRASLCYCRSCCTITVGYTLHNNKTSINITIYRFIHFCLLLSLYTIIAPECPFLFGWYLKLDHNVLSCPPHESMASAIIVRLHPVFFHGPQKELKRSAIIMTMVWYYSYIVSI